MATKLPSTSHWEDVRQNTLFNPQHILRLEVYQSDDCLCYGVKSRSTKGLIKLYLVSKTQFILLIGKIYATTKTNAESICALMERGEF